LTDASPDVLLPAALPFASGLPAQAGYSAGRLLGLGLAVSALLVAASVAATRARFALRGLARAWRTAHRRRNLTPQKIVGYEGPARPEETPGVISRRIVECSEQIQRVLAAKPTEVEVAMCAIGYATCVGDLLALSQLVRDRYPTCGPIRQIRMRVVLSRAADSLARTRKALPACMRSGPLGADTQEGAP
jgi:hypothetical protein